MDLEKLKLQKCINEMLKNINESTISELKEKLSSNQTNQNGYICSKCHTCLFYNESNMGLSRNVNKCGIQHKDLKWISACDCRSECLNNIYNRDCKYYSNRNKLYVFIEKEKERILKEVDNENL